MVIFKNQKYAIGTTLVYVHQLALVLFEIFQLKLVSKNLSTTLRLQS